MPRFPAHESRIKDNKAVISGTDYRHIDRVLRLKAGYGITLFDPDSESMLEKLPV